MVRIPININKEQISMDPNRYFGQKVPNQEVIWAKAESFMNDGSHWKYQ